jgi:hypothetical protein
MPNRSIYPKRNGRERELLAETLSDIQHPRNTYPLASEPFLLTSPRMEVQRNSVFEKPLILTPLRYIAGWVRAGSGRIRESMDRAGGMDDRQQGKAQAI